MDLYPLFSGACFLPLSLSSHEISRRLSSAPWVESVSRRFDTSVATAVEDRSGNTIDGHVAALPWEGTTGLDWSRMPASHEFDLVGKSPAEVYAWVKTTGLGRRNHIAVWYSREDGGIVVPLRVAAEALDELYRGAPGPRFAFGAEIESSGAVQPFFADLLQYGHGDLLVATALVS